MRVAVVSLRTGPYRETGATRRLRKTARLLADRGHDVTVFCSQWWSGDAEHVVGDVRYCAVTEDHDADRLFAAALPALLALHGPDLVHAGYAPPEQVLGARLGAALRRAPLVVDWYGDEPVEGHLADLAARAGDAVVAPSRLVETWVRERGVDGDAVSVVPDSVDMDLVRGAPVEGDADVVYARSLDGDANLESLLLALAELRDREWSCLVVGDGPARERYEQQARDLRIDDRVEFAGELPIQDRLSAYRAAGTFVQTAHREPFALELLWAMACGCVGVVEYQAASSAHELIEQRDRGIRTTDDVELSEAVVRSLEMEHRDVDESFAEFDDEAVLEELLALYEDVRERKGLL